MGQSLSTPEKVLKYSRAGDYGSLRGLLTDLQQHSREYRDNRARFLEVADEAGSTPLLLAAQRGSFQCVELLLAEGAILAKQNARPDGGSALHEAVARRHDHIVDLLLRAGASPFVENARGFTAMDLACAGRSVEVLRRMEAAAPFRGWLLMKVPRFGGLGSEWQRRWCVVSHRLPYPRARQQVTHVVLLAYKRTDASAPACRAWLDGASAREVYHPKAVARLQGRGPAQVGLMLHPKHDLPAGAFATGGAPSQPFTLHLRPDEGGQAAIDSLRVFMELVNNRGIPPTSTPTSPAAAAQHQQQQPQAAVGSTGAALRPSGSMAGVTQQPAPQHGRMASTPGDWNFSPLRQGAPGVVESDEAMARRLQQEYDAELAQHMGANAGAGGAAPSSSEATPVSATSAAAGPFGPAPSQPSSSYYPDIDYNQRHGSGSIPTTPGTAGAGAAGAGPARPSPFMGGTSAPGAPSAGLAAGGSGFGSPTPQALPARRPSAPPLIDIDSPPAAQPASRPGSSAAAQAGDEAWWAPAPSPTAAAAPAPTADEEMCVVCMELPATAGFLHGESVHRCCCRGCAQMLKDSNTRLCPMCRAPIQGFIMQVF